MCWGLLAPICHFHLSLWVNVLFSPTVNFKISAFALQDLRLKPQIRCNIDMLIISSSPRQQQRYWQHRKRCIFWPLYISKSRNFSYQVLSEKAFWFWREQSPTPGLSSAGRWTKDTQAFCSSQWVVLVHLIHHLKGALNCFLKEPSSMRQGKDKRYITWIHYISLSENKPTKQKTPKPNSQTHALPTKSISERAACSGLSQGPFAKSVLLLCWLNRVEFITILPF